MFQYNCKSIHLQNIPPNITIDDINLIKDIFYLTCIENKYHNFIEQNLIVLNLTNKIEYYLDIRDYIYLRICILRISERKLQLLSSQKK
jgi:type III secretory pathway component EscR